MITFSRRIRPVLSLILVVALFGCASYSGSSLKVGAATKADVRALMGAPAAVHAAPVGAAFMESWEYPRGPAGRHTYMARFDQTGKLVAMDQVLTVATVARIRIGQDGRDEISRLLGRPGIVIPAKDGGESWDYAAYAESVPGRKVRLIVTFDKSGHVVAAGESFDVEDFNVNATGGST